MFIGIVRNNFNSQAVDASLLVRAYLSDQSIDCKIIDASQLGNDILRDELQADLPEQIDMLVVLGGDGTILHSAHLVETRSTPILGINFGSLGFLANPSDDGVVAIVAGALAGDVVEDRRTMLTIDVVCEGESDRYADKDGDVEETKEINTAMMDIASATEGAAPAASPHSAASLLDGHNPSRDSYGVNLSGLNGCRRFYALNEIAVTRGALGQLINFTLDISGSRIASMRGDGLIVATATGSTAYTLSAGGPVVSPGYSGLIVTPLAPHTLQSRAIVTAENDVIEMGLDSSYSYREATLFVDGEMLLFDRPVCRVYVRRSDHPVTLLRYKDADYYNHVSRTFF